MYVPRLLMSRLYLSFKSKIMATAKKGAKKAAPKKKAASKKKPIKLGGIPTKGGGG